MANPNPVLGKRFSAEDLRTMFPQAPESFIEDYTELTEIVYNLGAYLPQQYAGNPNGNVVSNISRLCVDTTNNFMYYNLNSGVSTGWTKIIV